MFLTDVEIDAMCAGLSANSHAARVKRLQAMGLIVNQKPNGRPLVVRSHAEAVLSGMPTGPADSDKATREPAKLNTAGIVALFGKRAA